MTVAETAERALELFVPSAPAVVVSDVRMEGMGGLKLLESIKRLNPALPVVMMTAFGSIPDAVEAMRLGAYDYVTKPFTADHIVHVVARALEVHELRAENKELRDRIESLTEPEPFLTYSPHSRKLAEIAAQVADSDATALITGESGTGKSMLASYIHRLSPRKDGPFVQVACTTLSEHLLESELFGHVRGSFTGAIKDKPGRLEAAEGGTVLLDEIGDLTPVVQSKLLRFSAGADVRARRRCADDQSGRAHYRRDQSASRATGQGKALPRGSLLPAQRDRIAGASAARPAG